MSNSHNQRLLEDLYRKYKDQGLSDKEADAMALAEFYETAEE